MVRAFGENDRNQMQHEENCIETGKIGRFMELSNVINSDIDLF